MRISEGAQAGAPEGSVMYEGGDIEVQLVSGRSRPKIDRDLAVIRRMYREPNGCMDGGGDSRLCVTFEDLLSWNAPGGIRDRAYWHGILTGSQNVVLSRAIEGFGSQTILVREATVRTIRALEGCDRRTRLRGDVSLQLTTSNVVSALPVGWGRFRD